MSENDRPQRHNLKELQKKFNSNTKSYLPTLKGTKTA